MRTNDRPLRGLVAFVLGLVLATVLPVAYGFHFPWDQGHDTTDWNDPNDPGPCDEPTCDPCASTGSPVYIPTGHFIWSEADISMPGRPGLSLTRTYNSNDARRSSFGNGWTTGCEVALFRSTGSTDSGPGTPVESTQYVLRYPNGKRYTYTQNSDGTVTAPPGRYDRVTVEAGGQLRLVDESGSVQVFNANGSLHSQTDPSGSGLSYEYEATGHLARIADGAGRYLDFTYDTNGRARAVVDHTGRSWTYAYDAAGNLVEAVDPAGGTRRYEYRAYQATGDGHTYQQLTRITDATGVVLADVVYSGARVESYTVGQNRFTFSYNTGTRRVTKTDSLGSRWTYDYNDQGLITQRIDPLGNPERFAYDGQGQLLGYTDGTGALWSTTYDAAGRKLTQANPLGETKRWAYSAENPRPERTLSASGRETVVRYDATGNIVEITDPTSSITRMSWDAAGNLVSVTDAEGGVTTIAPNAFGLPASSTDPLGRSTRFSYDALGGLTRIQNDGGEAITFSYDVLGRLTGTTDPSGKSASYAFDASGRLLRVTDAAGRTTTYDYDDHGRLESRTYPDGQVASYDYRQDNLLSRAIATDGTTKTLTYDAAKRLLAVDVGGLVTNYAYDAAHRLTSATNGVGSVDIAYDAAGRVVSETVNDVLLSNTLNADGERVGLQLLGDRLTFSRSARGHVTAITAPEGNYTLDYDDLGRRTQLVLPGGATVDYAYNAASQVSSLTHTGPFSASYQYEYDSAGMLATWSGDGADWIFEYDEDAVLTRAQHGTELYEYSSDDAGNLTGGGRVFDSGNRLVQDDGFLYTYDARGNMVGKRDRTTGARTEFGWNALNQLLSVQRFPDAVTTVPDSTVSYAYGPFGRRWLRVENGVTERFVYDGADRIATLDVSGGLLHRVTFGPAVDEPLGMVGPAQERYFHADHLGSIVALSDGNAVSDLYAYTPYGGTVSSSGATDNDFRYTAREYEADDLYYYRARYYNPQIQRFISEDPAGFASGDLNLYRYAGNNPVNFTDPSGNIWPAVLVVWGAIEVGLAIYDAYDTADTIFDPCKSGWEKAIAGGLFALGAIAPGGGYSAADDIAEAAIKNGDDLVDLYRAVGPDEFYDIFDNGLFRPGPNSLDAKQFGHSLDEVLELSDHLPDASAIVKTQVPRSVFDQLDHTPVDTSILRSGTTTVQPDQLDLFNNAITNIEHAY